MPALHPAVRQLRQEAQGLHPAAEPPPDLLRQAPVGHGGTAAEDHAPDPAVLPELQKPGEDRQDRQSRPLGRNRQHNGRIRQAGRLPAAGPGGGQARAVIVPHNPLDDGHVPARAVLRQQVPQGVPVKEKWVQISAPGPDDPAVEHGVDVIRPALKGARVQPPVHQGLQYGAGGGGLSAPAAGSRQQDAGDCFLHVRASPFKFLPYAVLYKARRGLSTECAETLWHPAL